MAIQFQIRRDSSDNWTKTNPTLADGEMGLETDTNKFKFGNGVSSWNGLPYFKSGNVDSVNGQTGVVTITLNNLANEKQLNAINSGITSENVTQISANKNSITEINQKKQDKIDDLPAIRSGSALGSTAVQPTTLNDYATKQALTDGLATKQPVGDYATKQELEGKQDTIPDLAEIREGATAGATAVQGVKINGADLTKDADNKVNIPVANTTNKLGLVQTGGTGVGVTATGLIYTSEVSESQILQKTNQYNPITARRLDYAVKVGVTTNTKELTDIEKANACNWLGAGQQRTTVVDSTTPTITLDNALANTDYQYGTITSLTISAVENSYLETNFYFTAGSEITVDLPDTLKIIGTPSFEANKQYAMSICNNTLIVGTIS